MKSRKITRKAVAITFVLVAISLLITGARHKHRVYDGNGQEFGRLTFERISEAQLVVESTFSGTERRNGRLYSTYDRTEPHGKQTCPT